MPRLFGSKMKYKKSLVRNIKRAGGVSTLGRRVQIAPGSRCQCDNAVWCPLTNGKGFKLTAPKDCNVFIKSIDSILIGGKVEADGLARAGEVITINFTANQRLNVTLTTVTTSFTTSGASTNNPVLTETNGDTFRYKITLTVAAGDNGDLSFTITPVSAYRIGKNPKSAEVTLKADRNGNTVTADTIVVSISSTTWTGITDTTPNRQTLTGRGVAEDWVLAGIGENAVMTVKFSEALSAAPKLDSDPTAGAVAAGLPGVLVANTDNRDYAFSWTTTGTVGAETLSTFTFTNVTDLAGNNVASLDTIAELLVDDIVPRFTITADHLNAGGAAIQANLTSGTATTNAVGAGEIIRFTLTLDPATPYSNDRKSVNAQLMKTQLAIADCTITGTANGGSPTVGNFQASAATHANNGPFTFDYTVVAGDVGHGAGRTVIFDLAAAAIKSLTGVDNAASTTFTASLK